MIVTATFPPLWRRMMDHRVLAHYGGDLERANIHPRTRRRVLARYGPRRAAHPRPARRSGDTGGRRAMSAWRCPGCGYTYDEQAGHPREGFPAGTPWSEVPDDWACPDCGVRDKVDFEPVAARTSDRVDGSEPDAPPPSVLHATLSEPRRRLAAERAPAERTPYAEAARELLRNTLLDGARDELQRRSWAEITMADIAAAAGVSRQTLYKEFGSRDEFAQAFVMREVDRFLAAVEVAVREHLDDPATALSAAFDVFLTAAAEDPLVRTLLSGEEAYGLLALVTTQGEPVVAGATDTSRRSSSPAGRRSTPPDARLLAECLVRLAISYAALPAGPAGMTAASVTTLLGPYIERVLAQAPATGASA